MSYGVYVTKPSQAPATGIFLFVLLCLASRVEWERWALYTPFVRHVTCDG